MPLLKSASMVSALPEERTVPASAFGGSARELDVPPYSQEIHRGHYPEYDNGGEAWCSPTSTSTVVGSWNTGPTPAQYAYVLADHPDRPAVQRSR